MKHRYYGILGVYEAVSNKPTNHYSRGMFQIFSSNMVDDYEDFVCNWAWLLENQSGSQVFAIEQALQDA